MSKDIFLEYIFLFSYTSFIMRASEKSISYYAIGLMSGTSIDGLDVSYSFFEFKDSKWKFELIHSKAITYSVDLKKVLKDSISMSGIDLTIFNRELGEFFADEVSKFIEEKEITKIDVIGSHGHTVFHQPDKGFTLQIGDPVAIHTKTKIKVVANFRSQDINLGGQGAPLVPIGDKLLFSDYDYRINLGGFANISFQNNDKTIAFDICAVNTILNSMAYKLGYEYDDKGEISKSGNLIPELLEELDNIDFYNQTAPKSLGIEWNTSVLIPILDKYKNDTRTEDLLHTYTIHVARQINKVIVGSNKKVLITGGGTFNEFLISLLKKDTYNNIIIESEEITNFKEAIIFSFLAVLKIRGEVNCLASVTGAEKDHSSGEIYDFMLS